MKKVHIIAVACLLLSMLCMNSLAYGAACSGGSVKKGAGTGALEVVRDSADLIEKIEKLKELTQSEGCAEIEKCRVQVTDLLNDIIAQANRIESQIPVVQKGITRWAAVNKLKRLKNYVVQLRGEAKDLALPYL